MRLGLSFPVPIIVTAQGEPVTIRAIERQARDIAVRQGNVYDVPLARFEDRLFVLHTVTRAARLAFLGEPVRVWRGGATRFPRAWCGRGKGINGVYGA